MEHTNTVGRFTILQIQRFPITPDIPYSPRFPYIQPVTNTACLRKILYFLNANINGKSILYVSTNESTSNTAHVTRYTFFFLVGAMQLSALDHNAKNSRTRQPLKHLHDHRNEQRKKLTALLSNHFQAAKVVQSKETLYVWPWDAGFGLGL